MSADANGLQNALKRAQEELKRLTEQLRASGRAAQDFGKIDFGQLPGDMARHMERVQKQYRDLLAMNNDLRRRLEMSGQQGASPFDIDWERMGYLNRRTQEEARRRIIEQSARGTPWQPPAGGGGQGGGEPRAEEGGSSGFGGMLGGLMGGLKLGGAILGKPADAAEAADMLRRLSGRTHRVLTAVALARSSRRESVVNVSRVTFARLTRAQIDAYARSGEPLDKAGGYGIQGAAGAFARRIEGSYSGIMGLPLYETARLLRLPAR